MRLIPLALALTLTSGLGIFPESAIAQTQERGERALQNDPCTNGASKALLLKFGYADAAGQAKGNTRVSCKQLPNAPGTAVIAAFHLTTPATDDPSADDGDYDLHLILTDSQGRIQAQVREKNAAQSDAVRLDDVGIDTARYILAPNVRAFGVSTTNAAHCYQCVFSETKLSLFVPSGKSLNKVWSGLASSSGGDDSRTDEGCTSPVKEMRKLFSMGVSTNAGYADLMITTVTSFTPGFNPDNENQVCAKGAPTQRSTETWVYDGAQYKLKNVKPGNSAK